jgi:hypothetical protein
VIPTASLNNTLNKQTKAAELDTGDDVSRRNENRTSGTNVKVKDGGQRTAYCVTATPYTKDTAIIDGIQINFPRKNYF